MPCRSLVAALVLLHASASMAQVLDRGSGAELPSLQDALSVPWEIPFVLPKGTVLPDSVDLSRWFPPAGDQFAQASCSGWALGYGLATYQWNRVRGQEAEPLFMSDPTNVFSPAFVYARVAAMEGFSDCTTGVSLPDAVSVLCNDGVATWAQYPVDTTATNCLHPIPDSTLAAAALHRMAHPVAVGNRDFVQWRYHLSRGEPIIFLVSIGPFFNTGFLTKGMEPFVWDEPFPSDWSDRTGHIMVCTGYDADSSFTALNSWGLAWGDRGYVRIPDSTMYWACSDAYVLRRYTAPAEPLQPAKPRVRKLRADGAARGRLGRNEHHGVDLLLIQRQDDGSIGSAHRVDIRDAESGQVVHTLLAMQGRSITFQHAGALYTFTQEGRTLLTRQLRYTLVKNDPAQQRFLQDRLDTYDLHGDGVMDGRW